MTRWYALASLIVVVGGILLLWPWMEPDGRRGVAAAGTAAYGVQVVAFWLLERCWRRAEAFMWAWAGGMTLRLLALAVMAAVVVREDGFPAAPTLLGLVGFLFALLVTEFFFVRPDRFGGAGGD